MKSSSEVIETQHFKKLTALVDKLRDIGLNDHISMPRIAVLGSQSSGKSSLLESIVGMNFLPRGSGVVTRRPLELRLCRVKDMKEPPYGIFAKEPDVKLSDFDKIREKIEKFTDEVCGKDKNIVDDPIVLKVFSPSCPDLTVIDLPGITRIPIGNQPKDIETITKKLVSRYCSDERTIILCVIPANADMTTSESLQLSQQLDPQGIRTVGVITKIDIMDKGTNAMKMLMNQEVPLHLGYIGVKGRSQLDVDNKVTVAQALKDEANYFTSHKVYHDLWQKQLGTDALVQRLTSVMYTHMRNVLPKIMKEIEFKISSCEKNVASLGVPIPTDHKEKLDQIWREISVFYDKFKAHVKGEYVDIFNKHQKENYVLASAQISILFNTLYKSYFNKLKYSDAYSSSDITKIVDMYSGNTLPGFVSVDCFIALLSPLLEGLRPPALDLVEKVYMILKTVGSNLMTETFSKVISIKEILLDLFDKILQNCKENTDDYINKFIDCETKVIYTKDPHFITKSHSWPEDTQKKDTSAEESLKMRTAGQPTANGVARQPTNPSLGSSQISSVPGQTKTEVKAEAKPEPKPLEKQTLDPKERREFLVKEMRSRIDQYFAINVRHIGDMIPKIISNFLINDLLDKIYFMMFRKVTDEKILNEIKEPDHIVQQRKNLKETLDVLYNSKKALLKDPDLNISFAAEPEKP